MDPREVDASDRHAACRGGFMSTRRPRSGSPPGGRGRTVALALSIALHAGVFAAIAIHLVGTAPAATRAGVLVRVVLPPGRLVPAPDADGPMPPPTVASAGSRIYPTGCRGTVYTGIGAIVNRAGFILELAPNGPARRAGLQPGDAILNLEDLPIDTYPAGQLVGLRLLRDGVQTTAEVVIGAICDEPEAPVV